MIIAMAFLLSVFYASIGYRAAIESVVSPLGLYDPLGISYRIDEFRRRMDTGFSMVFGSVCMVVLTVAAGAISVRDGLPIVITAIIGIVGILISRVAYTYFYNVALKDNEEHISTFKSALYHLNNKTKLTQKERENLWNNSVYDGAFLLYKYAKAQGVTQISIAVSFALLFALVEM